MKKILFFTDKKDFYKYSINKIINNKFYLENYYVKSSFIFIIKYVSIMIYLHLLFLSSKLIILLSNKIKVK